MKIFWPTVLDYKLSIDGIIREAKDSKGKVEVDLKPGLHHIEAIGRPLICKNFALKIIVNFLSGLCGTFGNSIDDMLKDSLDQRKQFTLFVDNNNMDLNLDIINCDSKLIKNLKSDNVINISRFRTVKLLFFVPMILLGLLLSMIFILIGIVIFESQSFIGGIFTILVGLLTFTLMLIFICKIKRQFKFKSMSIKRTQ